MVTPPKPSSAPSFGKDNDGDDLTDQEELLLGTNPEDADHDDDGLLDGEEYYGTYYGVSKLDAISNLTNEENAGSYKTDPMNPDSDGDGLPDGLELGRTECIPINGEIMGTDLTATFEFQDWNDLEGETSDIMTFIADADSDDIRTRTNPLRADTNTDGVIDGDEGLGDADGDGLPNCLDPASDNDGLHDGTELGYVDSDNDIYENRIITGFINEKAELPKGEKAVVNGIKTTDVTTVWFMRNNSEKDFYDYGSGLGQGGNDGLFEYARSLSLVPCPNSES